MSVKKNDAIRWYVDVNWYVKSKIWYEDISEEFYEIKIKTSIVLQSYK